MEQPIEKFQRLLRELFQFNCADLDFGIYRIMNYKRDVIERFIMKDLPAAIAKELERGALADQSQAAKELSDVAEQICKDLSEDALDADGNLARAYHKTRLGKKYLDLKTKAAVGRGRAALEANIINHLYTFFGRYYQDGDFISKRRYSKRQRYAIPYNGEEVYLYWANNDQYYVKTAEHFHDYTFTSYDVTVHFKLKYMLKWETRASETLLNVGKLAHPFSYKLNIHSDGQTRNKVADVPETFNYLLGLHAQTRRVYDDGRRYLVYRGRD
jgi:adenine-specific DNA-methyltransferase